MERSVAAPERSERRSDWSTSTRRSSRALWGRSGRTRASWPERSSRRSWTGPDNSQCPCGGEMFLWNVSVSKSLWRFTRSVFFCFFFSETRRERGKWGNSLAVWPRRRESGRLWRGRRGSEMQNLSLHRFSPSPAPCQMGISHPAVDNNLHEVEICGTVLYCMDYFLIAI